MVAVTMRGALEPVLLDEGFMDTIKSLNDTAIQGKEFVLSRDPDGAHIGFALHNILTVKEVSA